MTSTGIQGFVIETHNWGKTAAFWKGLGYEVEFETDHNSGQLRHPDSGPYLFIVEQPEDADLTVMPIVQTADSATFAPPAAGTVDREFEPQHWGITEMLLRDPDGRLVSVAAPLPEGAEAPAGHH
jgi:hypothetical protein